MKNRLEAMIEVFKEERMRWLTGKGKILIDEGKMKDEEYGVLMEHILLEEMERKMILKELKSTSLTVSQISERISIPAKEVFKHLTALRNLNIVSISGEKNKELEFKLE